MEKVPHFARRFVHSVIYCNSITLWKEYIYSEMVTLRAEHGKKQSYRIREVDDSSTALVSHQWIDVNLDSPWLATSNLGTWILWSAYLYLECALIYTAQQISGRTLWHAWLAVAAEVGIMWPDSMVSGEVLLSFIFGTSKNERRCLRLEGNEVPTVDVCIACCGESVQVILDTITSAASQDYPSHRYRIFVLDDACSAELKERTATLAKDILAAQGPSTTYLARKKAPGVRHYYKAGNIRHGFEESALDGAGSELFAALDADMIVKSDWLRRVIPHLLKHDELALACPPQVCVCDYFA